MKQNNNIKMKATELRSGNWVQINNQEWPNLKGVKFKVTSIECNGLMLYSIRGIGNSNYNQYDYNIEPIPLTEEWFLKFGFEIKNHSSIDETPIYSKGEIDIDYCFSYADFREDYSFYVEYTDSPFDSDTDKLYPVSFGIKYVHQLQNLWFTLTGEELI